LGKRGGTGHNNTEKIPASEDKAGRYLHPIKEMCSLGDKDSRKRGTLELFQMTRRTMFGGSLYFVKGEGVRRSLKKRGRWRGNRDQPLSVARRSALTWSKSNHFPTTNFSKGHRGRQKRQTWERVQK